MNTLIFFYGIISFFVTLLITPWLIKFLWKIGLVVKDQNKKNTPLVVLSGGMAVLVGVMAGFFSFMFFRKFVFGDQFFSVAVTNDNLVILFAAMISLFIVTFVGFLDDLIVNKSKDRSEGLKQWQKPLLTVAAAIPLMVVKAGNTAMTLPFFGRVDFGIWYALILIPLGIIGASNMVNMLAGFNGMEAGMGIIYFGMLGLYAYFHASYLAAFICLIVFSSLLAFFLFNKVPAKILPGDSLTYLMGGALAIVAIVGNIEKAAVICSIPFFIEFVLKLRGKLKVQSYGYEKNGKIFSRSGNSIYSLPHIFSRTGRFTEKQITWFMILIMLIFCSLIWVI